MAPRRRRPRLRGDQSELSPSPSPPRMSPERDRRERRDRRDRRDQRFSWFPYPLPNGEEIRVYKDKNGVLFTDHGGPTRPLEDVLSDLRRDLPPPDVAESGSKRPEEDRHKATPNPRPSPAQYTEEDQQTPTPDPGPSPAQYTREDQPAPQQTPTPNFYYDGIEKSFAEHKVDMAKRRKELLEIAKLEELSITNASSSSLPHSPSRKELLDTTKLEESSITNASSSSLPQPTPSKELLDTTTPEESSITSAPSSSLPQSPLPKELLETAKMEESSITNASSSYSSLPQSPSRKELLDTTTRMESSITSVSSSSLPESPLRKELLVTTTLEEPWITNASVFSLPKSPSCEVPDLLALKLHNALMLSSFVCSMVPTGLFIKYFTRMDKEGFFHTYPDRGRAFRTLEEAQEAINTHHAVQRKNMCMEGLSDEEMTVRNALYWYYDGTRKHSAEAFASVTSHPTRELVKALLDTHNEHNDLLGDDAYELIDIVREEECFDGKGCIYRSYSHFNLTMKTKGADANSDLYFAEVTCMRGDYEAYVLTCLCVVKPDEGNGKCNVCQVSMKDMKHPTDNVYNQGRPRKFPVRSQGSAVKGVDLFEKLYAVHDESWLNAEEARVRRMVKEEREAMKLEVDKRADEMIKEVKESRCKLEVGNKRDGHGKTYVVPARRK